MTVLGDSWPSAYMPVEVYFGRGIQVCCRSVVFCICNSTFGLYGFLNHFMLAWIILFDPPLSMGMSMLRAAQKYVGIYLGMHKLPQCISRCRQDKAGMARTKLAQAGHKSAQAGCKSVWAGTQVIQPSF